MYCSNCGNTINDKLNYCNICGDRLVAEADNSHKPVLIVLIVSLALIAISGLGSFIGLLAMLLSRGVKDELIVMLAGGHLFILFAVIFTIGRQISKLIDGKLLNKNKNTEAYLPPQISAPNTAQLEEAKQPFSVIDNTTKTLNEVFVKRR